MAGSPLFVAYWLGYDNQNMAVSDLPSYVDVVDLFLINLNPDTTLSTNYITSNGMSWQDILTGAQALQKNGTRVLASIMSTQNPHISWNTIADPATFASQVKSIVVDTWGLDGIDIDPEIDKGVAPNDTFIQVVKELSSYFGPNSGTGKMMTYASFDLDLDGALLKQVGASFDYVGLMGYFWNFGQMKSEFKRYAKIMGDENVLLGVAAGNGAITPFSEVVELAEWNPSHGSKGGMLLYDINNDANFTYASAINQHMKSPGQQARTRTAGH